MFENLFRIAMEKFESTLYRREVILDTHVDG